jgi:hypothetical protein
VVDGNVVIHYDGGSYYTVNGDSFDVETIGVDDQPGPLPKKIAMSNYPNPFNAQTAISYGLPEASHVTLTVYDILGRSIAVLVDGDQQAGIHKAIWDASASPSGVYFYSIKTDDALTTQKMLLIK